MRRRPSNTRIAAFVSALAAGVLAALALRPGPHAAGSSAGAAAQVAEVRTQVIRRTIHVVHHERPPRPHASAPRQTGGGASAASPAVHTGASGSHAAGGATAEAPRSRTSALSGSTPAASGTAPRSRTSGAGSATGGGSTTPARTRSSGAAGGGSGTSVRTRSSGDGGGGHDD